MEDEKLLKDLFTETHSTLDYYADVKIDEIAEGIARVDLSTEEYKLLHQLIITKTGRSALTKVLKDYGESNLFSTLVYIDGGTGTKPLEIVNDSTGKPIADGMLHEYYADFNRSKES